MHMTEQKQSQSHWHAYEGKPVFVQLRAPYIGVTYPNVPFVRMQKVQDPDGQIRDVEDIGHTIYIRGILRVRVGDAGATLLVVETLDPKEETRARAEVVLNADDVLYLTYLEKQLVERV
jgi:hypothetical protein